MLKNTAIGLVAAIHFYFLLLEMVFWTKPLGLRAFGQSLARAKESAVFAANQGLYNGFLAAGLIWSIVHPDPGVGVQLAKFFLGCVIAAGVFGGVTGGKKLGPKILIIQGLPAVVAMVLVYWG